MITMIMTLMDITMTMNMNNREGKMTKIATLTYLQHRIASDSNPQHTQ